MASTPPPAVPTLATGPVPQNMMAQSKRALETSDKKNQKNFHGFIAGVTSGVTKLAVGHPFGTQRNTVREEMARFTEIYPFV